MIEYSSMPFASQASKIPDWVWVILIVVVVTTVAYFINQRRKKRLQAEKTA
jgi:preprotein translocase subunit YajC